MRIIDCGAPDKMSEDGSDSATLGTELPGAQSKI